MFVDWPLADIHLYMDASNQRLAVLDPAERHFIQVRFDTAELAMMDSGPAQGGFTINVREQLSMAFAVAAWGPVWRRRFQGGIGQVWCWVDNTTAVSTTNKLASRNAFAQELNRVIGFAEATQRFRIRCLHLPGRLNHAADAASRAWSQPHADVWVASSQG